MHRETRAHKAQNLMPEYLRFEINVHPRTLLAIDTAGARRPAVAEINTCKIRATHHLIGRTECRLPS